MTARVSLAAPLLIAAAIPIFARAQDERAEEQSAPAVPEGVSVERVTGSGAAKPAPRIPTGQGFVKEVEPNGTAATATPLGGANVAALGNIFPAFDADYYSFTGSSATGSTPR